MSAQSFKPYLVFCCLLYLACTKQAPDPSSENFVETQAPVLTAITKNIDPVIQGYYQALPAHYHESGKKYPLLVFIHGGGQFGNGSNDLPDLLREGIPELLSEKVFPANFKVNGKNYSFIVLTPQFVKYPSNDEVRAFITYALSAYRIDPSHVYLSGMSIGAEITCDAAAAFPSLFAAVVPMAGASAGNVTERCKSIADAKLPIWIFHNEKDEVIDIEVSKNFIATINSFTPVVPPKFTIFPTFGILGHDAWSKATDPRYKENNMNIYEWMLQYSR